MLSDGLLAVSFWVTSVVCIAAVASTVMVSSRRPFASRRSGIFSNNGGRELARDGLAIASSPDDGAPRCCASDARKY